ncbi:MAG: transposase [Bacteroidota bacterium]|jgi:REP element-mobilizing transposase RayT
MQQGRHRNSQKRIYGEGYAYFITTVTDVRYRYFENPIIAELCARDTWFVRALKQCELHGYTVLPDHMHLMITPTEKANYSEIMGTLKRNVARDINDMTANRPFIRNLTGDHMHPAGEDSILAGDDSIPIGEDSNPHLRDVDQYMRENYELTRKRHPHLSFETYKEHFVSLEKMRHRFLHEFPDYQSQRFQWQSSFRDHIIRSEKDFQEHLNYIYGNAVEHGLAEEPEQWRWMWIAGMPLPGFIPFEHHQPIGEYSNAHLTHGKQL